MSPPPIGRIWRTIRPLRAEQVWGQLRRASGRIFGGGVRPVRAGGEPASLGRPALVPWLAVPEHLRATTPDRLTLLGEPCGPTRPVDWSGGALGPLARFHLHYCDWVRSEALGPEERLSILGSWVDAHPSGIGWGPAPTSVRILAWLKLLASPGALPANAAPRLLPSLADQLATLRRNLETHLLANHYLSNLLALVAGGVALRGAESERWLGYTPALLAELDEEFPGEGGHYERSPMYHAELLERVLDLLNLVRGQPERAPTGLDPALVGVVERARRALRVWTHPDGSFALFADSSFGVTAEPAELHRYAEALGVGEAPDEPTGVLGAAGFVRLAAGPFTMIASVGGPAPDYQPGHSHCDALSFELSVGDMRVVTDTGVFEYAPGERRDHCRATAAHATLQLDGHDQAELWSAHRIGGRPRVVLGDVEPGRSAVASCSGWATPDLEHRRRFTVSETGLQVEDRLSRPAAVLATLPLAPGIEPELAGERVRIPLGSLGLLEIELPTGLRWRRVRAPYYPAYGREESRWSLVGEGATWSEGAFRFELRS